MTVVETAAAESRRRSAVSPLTRRRWPAARRGRGYTAYIEAITARSTCAVQMLEVAFSRRMCCSRVCRASRRAGLPGRVDRDPHQTARQRPLVLLAGGHETGVGTAEPERNAEPLGRADHGVGAQVARGLEQAAGRGGRWRPRRIRPTRVDRARPRARWSRIAPLLPGYDSSTPNTDVGVEIGLGVADDDLDAQGLGAGADHLDGLGVGVGVDEEGVRRLGRTARRAMVIASAAAVASSRSEALARSRPARSETIVWKLRSASSRPCEISGW